MKGITDVLKQNGLSVTTGRKKILELFSRTQGALAHADIEKKTGLTFDRVTVYRTLQTFVEKGILHQIPTADNNVLYALCKHGSVQGKHQDNHVHFVCEHCQKTVCLDHVMVPTVKLPLGFTPLRSAMLVHGVCLDCKKEIYSSSKAVSW